MPRRLQIEFSQVIQKITDETGKEISASDIWETFQETYFNENITFQFLEHHINSRANKEGLQEDEIEIKIKEGNKTKSIKGSGNGPIDALINALSLDLDLEIKIADYHQHAISSGSDAKAVAYSEISYKEQSVWGIGIHQNTVIAGLESIISGLNRLSI